MSLLARRSFLKSGLSLASLSLLQPFTVNPVREDGFGASILPPRLNKGDKVAIMGMAGALRDITYIETFKTILTNLGFNVVLGKTLTKVVGYLSGSDDERAGEFNAFIADESIKGIFFIKGGWGCGRVLDKIDYNQVKSTPKIIIGFSDITSLLCAIHQKTGVVTFHGPVGNSSWDQFSSTAFSEIVCNGGLDFDATEKTQIQPLKTLHNGVAKGPLVGGNLTVFCSLLGTPYFPDCTGKILFLEETHEEPYSVDRLLNSLRLAGVFNEISGLIFGQFNDCLPEKPQESFLLEEVVNQHVAGLDIPILWGAPFGHVKEKWTLPIGVEAILNTESLTLKLIHPAVS